MKTRIRYLIAVIVLTVAAIVLQGTIVRVFLPNGPVPNISLIVVVFLASNSFSPRGVSYAFLTGLLYDLFAARSVIGPYAVASIIAYCVVAILSQRLYMRSLGALILMVIVASITSHIAYALLLTQFINTGSLLSHIATFSLFETFFTALIAIPLVALLRFALGENMNTQTRYQTQSFSTLTK